MAVAGRRAAKRKPTPLSAESAAALVRAKAAHITSVEQLDILVSKVPDPKLRAAVRANLLAHSSIPQAD